MGLFVCLVLAFLIGSKAQYFDPVLFQQDGKGEVSDTTQVPINDEKPTDEESDNKAAQITKIASEKFNDEEVKDNPKDTASRISSKVSNAAFQATEDMSTLNRDIKRQPGVVVERWDGLDGYDIKNMVKSSRYPTLPNLVIYSPTFSEPDNWGDSYGSRIRGYFVPPQTGNYLFRISSDAQGQLYISTDENPRKKVMIAEISGDHYSDKNQYDKYREQRSQYVSLDKGKYYYMEALHKEQFLDDHLEVEVTLPDNTTYAPIPSKFLWTLPPPKRKGREEDPLALIKVAAKAGAQAGATLGQKEAAEKGAQAGALAGERAGVQAGAAAGAIAARKAATAIAMKTLSEALRNISMHSRVLNVYTSKGGASASAVSNVNVGAGTDASAGSQTSSSTGGAKGSGKGKGEGVSGKVVTTETQPGPNLPVVEAKIGENVEVLAKTYVTPTGSVGRVVIGSKYIIHSMNIPATHDFHKNLCWRGLFGRVVLGRRCQVFIARKGFKTHKDGQQTVAWESVCAPGYFIIQKNYNFKLAKLDNTEKFQLSATFAAFRTLKFPEAFMFELMHKGWFMCESLNANFHITNLVARYNEPTITWIQRCSFVIRLLNVNENPMMNCFFVLPVVPQKSKPTPQRNITTLPPANLTTPAPTTIPTEVVHFVICLRIEFVNDAGFPYRLFSSLKPGGYFVYGRVFVVKYVLPKKSKAVTPAPKKPTDASSKYLGQRDRIEKTLHLSRKDTLHYQMDGRHRYSRALNEDEKLDMKMEKGRNIKMRRHLKGWDKRKNKKESENENNSSSKRRFKSEEKKHDWKKGREKEHIESKKSITHIDGSKASAKEVLDEISTRKTVHENNSQDSQRRSEVEPSDRSAEEVLKEISPESAAATQPQAAMIERFPRPRNTIANAFTHIIFSAEDPLKRYELLIDEKKNITMIVSQDCENPVDLKLTITKRPFTTPPPATVKTTPPTTASTTPKTTPAPPPPLPFPPPPPPPLPPPPPPIPPSTTPTTPSTPPPTTAPSTTPKPTPPPTTAGPPPLPLTAVPAPPPPLPPPPPPLPPPPPPATPPPPPTVIIVPPVEGCMPTHEGTSDGACCVFPFVYQGVKQHGCIRAERKYRWCATTGNYDKDKQWGFCPHCYLAHGGTGAGECCHFPFVYNGKMYMQCLKDSNGKPWCATTFSFDHDKKFGYCGDPGKTPSPEKCPPSCAIKCQPSCPVQCCSGSKQAEQTCPAMCAILCTPDCPAKCCAMPKGSNVCPPQCAKECQPDCPAKCCTRALKLENTKPGTHECPEECLESCKPYCPEKCCVGELVPIVIEKDDCPKKCLRSCLPECSSKCCRGLLIEDKTIITGLPCPQQCSLTTCKPECPEKCCAEATPMINAQTNECPPECSSQPCNPDCPSKCCMAVLSPVTAAPTCLAQCAQTCAPTCPAECCATPTPAPAGCNQECLTLCKPDCPAKCCTAKCPPECAKSCGPNCPDVCCPEGTMPDVQNCPKECSPSACKPDCPAKCCTTVLSPLEPGSTCPTICYQTCQPDCPAKCCKPATAIDSKPETCPAECGGKCQPGCPAKCCVIVLTPMKQGNDDCPSSCSQACLPVCPAKCCEVKPEEQTSLSPSKPEPCPPSCSWACLPTCPVRCCPKSFPGEDATSGSTKATCPAPCLVSCKPACPFKCCLEAFTNPTVRASIAASSLGSCPASCYTKCTPSCPVKCCSIVVTYDKKNSIKNAKKNP